MERHSAYKTIGKPTYETAGNEREIAILKLLARYDLLPSSFIYHALGKYQGTRKALTLLAKGHYIGLPDLPKEEKLAYIPRNAFYVFELKPRGRMLLAKHGDIVTQGGNDHFKHRLLRSEIEFLLDRTPFEVKGPEHILADDRCPEGTKDASYPFRIERPKLEPDITRGFSNGSRTIFLHIEVDRGTEPVISQNARQSLKSKVERYSEYLRTETYKTHFGFQVAPSVLFLTTRPDTKSLIDLFPEKGKTRFYAASIPPKLLPTDNLIVPWQGKDGTLNLMELLHGRIEETGARERIGA
ncbi:hypothetical protein EDE08_101672 [Bradyrhizobium sp. R2.2-H]|jgi:hypothetical protein|uniref:replication-relaxation family protein n=1 Tax=unclassified Bradyrhizobium TaxID=2631580 RepID=UPI00104B8999|nr:MULTISPECIES: replication-relaxation family protein [unclassified Bradyrhizobium]TCU78889.1 hypothetical protein EDE10_101673 [Bradyrhizobium sp. Y-H1]TCU80972.1 hypothetical protein EDE08_101672 [Bradyrhizobium sp. R2.2-H]